MTKPYPIFTTRAECRDCYKCVRRCPVKAIRIENGVASVLPERCVACGQCVRICPTRAKRVRDDSSKFVELCSGTEPVYVSLAPSWRGVLTEWSSTALIAALKSLGVAEVSETALGAQEVSAAVAEDLAKSKDGVFISSACPVVVDYVCKYHPNEARRVTKIASPALTHCALLRKTFGENIKIAFIGPCAAKKNEADRRPDLLDVALTFDELQRFFAEKGLSPGDFETAKETFVPESAMEGTLYPVEGGMLETIRRSGIDERPLLQSTSGLQILGQSLEHLRSLGANRPVFIEALACPGGCVNGPCATKKSWLAASTGVLKHAELRPASKRVPTTRVGVDFRADPVDSDDVDAKAIQEALLKVGKTSPDDELNCGGCGYDSCREFAKALARGDAETSQCVSYMRYVATQKADNLLRYMPAGVAIVDDNLNIVESNEAFARIFGGELLELYRITSGLGGADIRTILPCASLFEAALQHGREINRDSFRVGDLLLDLTFFTIERGKSVGVIVRDVTSTELDREQIARRADEVMSRNVAVVQEIASKLGEHLADTQILLESIAQCYRPKTTPIAPRDEEEKR